MRREGTLFIVLWFILIGTIYIVYFNAKSTVINSIDAPRKVIAEYDNDNNQVSISWEPVRYATSYRIYKRRVDENSGKYVEGWSLVKAVPKDTNIFYINDIDACYQYSVKAYHSSFFGKTALSKYSEANVIGGTGNEK